MAKRALIWFAAVALAACMSGGTTTTTSVGTSDGSGGTTQTTGSTTGEASALAALQAEMAEFSSEIETAASVELRQAWNNLQAELGSLASAAQQGQISTEDVEEARLAMDEISAALLNDQVQLSAEFEEFWAEFTSQFNLVVNS
jgi:hypothetical protein